MNPQGIIFDFNGVLLWDSELHARAWKQVSAQLRGYPLSDREMIECVNGRTNDLILQYLLGRKCSPAETDEIAQAKEVLYRQMCLELNGDFQLSPGAVALLDALVAGNVPHAIASSSEKVNMGFYLQHLGLANWFHAQHIIYDDGTLPAGKPAPDIYLRAAQRLNLPPAACLVVEDSFSGIQAAYAAGIGCIVALGPAHSHAELADRPGVKRVITSLAEIGVRDGRLLLPGYPQ